MEKKKFSQIHILMADGDMLLARALASNLRAMGFVNIEHVRDGRNALQYINKHSVDLLLTEWNMYPVNGLELLRRHCQVYSAASIEAAVSLYVQHLPCIVFLDINLPEGSGHDFAKEVRRYDPYVFIIMITANDLLADMDIALQNNVQGFIIKSFSKKRILEFIDSWKQQVKMGNGEC